MNVNWFPGHMAQAGKKLKQQLKMIDVVLEVVDARIPVSSSNPDLEKILAGKLRILLLNKADLADSNVTDSWLVFYKERGIRAFAVAATKPARMKFVTSEIIKLAAVKKAKRGLIPVRSIAVGIPNVGKSQIINALAGRGSARTGNKPGVTKGPQWIRIAKGLDLLDTPGMLWPKIIGEEVGFRLAVTGALPEKVFDVHEAALELVHFLTANYGGALEKRYGILPELTEPQLILERIAQKRGLLLGGGLPNIEQAVLLLLKEFRSGLLGPISLEAPDNYSAVTD